MGNLKHFRAELRLFNSETLDSPERDSSHSKEKSADTAGKVNYSREVVEGDVDKDKLEEKIKVQLRHLQSKKVLKV